MMRLRRRGDSSTVTTVDVPVEDGIRLQADVFTPARVTHDTVVFFCVGGGNVTRGYFDLGAVAGGDRSFARAMTARGHVVITIDPVGVGGSTIPSDGFTVTVQDEARWIAASVARLRTCVVSGIDLSTLFTVGIGHSAGGMLIGATQGGHGCFDAIVLLGFGPGGLPSFVPGDILDRLARGEAARDVAADLGRRIFGDAGYFQGAPDPDTADGDLLKTIRCPYPVVVAALAIVPGNIAPELAAITCPVLVGISADDLIENPHQIGAAFTLVRDYALYIIPEATHEIFLSPRIRELYERLSHWLPVARASVKAAARPARTAECEARDIGRYDLRHTKLGILLDDEEVRALIEQHIPGMTTHRMIRVARSVPITRILPMTGVDDATQQRLLEGLAALPPR